jgi:hypothetical protein
MASRVDAARKVVGHPMTLSERKFYTVTYGWSSEASLWQRS